MKGENEMRRKQLLAVALISFGMCATTRAEDDDNPIFSAAVPLAKSIRSAGFTRVGVLPWVFTERVFAGGFGQNAPQSQVDSSTLTRMYVDEMQSQLAERSGGNYRMVDSFAIGNALRATGVDPSRLQPQDSTLKNIPSLVEGGIDGLILGTIVNRSLGENSPYSVRDIKWKLVDAKDPTSIAGAQKATKSYSLADLVYEGRSQEFCRWKDNRLSDFCFTTDQQKSKVPLNPQDAIELYDIWEGTGPQLNPVFNPNCPFKVSFKVEGKVQNLAVPVDKGSTFNGQTFASRVHNDEAYLVLNPGESWSVQARNGCSKPVLMAVFVDGINTLGKKRELPDRNCRVWNLEPGEKGVFKGWFSGKKGDEAIEEFVVTAYADSVAGQLGEKTRCGMITLVFFSSGYPSQNQLALPKRHYRIEATWDSARQRIVMDEGMEPAPPAGSFATGMSESEYGIGGKAPKPHPLVYSNVSKQGVILAAMTIRYGSEVDIKDLAEHGGPNAQGGLAGQALAAANPQFALVEAAANGGSD
jgi:hypothetical protein